MQTARSPFDSERAVHFDQPRRAALNLPGIRPLLWPGLAPDQLHEQRDLLHTTDFRDVLSEVVSVHLGNPNLGAVMPGYEARPVGIVA